MSEKIKVLIADDMEVLARNIAKVVEKNENVKEMKIVDNGKDLIDTIVTWEPDLVFTDNKMPILTGEEVIIQIQLMTDYPNKPKFVLVTSDTSSSIIENSRKYSFRIEYKPVDEESINYYIDQVANKDTIVEESERKETIKQKDNFIKRFFNNK